MLRSKHGPSLRKLFAAGKPQARLRLILPDLTAIGVRLSHASLRCMGNHVPGVRLSNTWPTYPKEGDNTGKLVHKPP